MAQDYKNSMNLPRTDFPMRANLAQREPEWIRLWDEIGLHARALERTAGAPMFVLHDGPPYANGHIHMGTAYNKVLKDLIVKYKAMRGYRSPYVPGWDCHGQPIEHQVEKNLGPEKMERTSQAELRRLCREWALEFVGVQREEFKRLGVSGDWDDPYLTLKPAYEAGNVKVFKRMFLDGAIYKGRKPIHWCKRCHTALAEAEIEYWDETSDSIYVKLSLIDPPAVWAAAGLRVSIVIWTTTPWTLPANVAVTLAAHADYVAVRVDGELLVVAERLLDTVSGVAGWDSPARYGPAVKGADLSGLLYRHPILEGTTGVIITGEHVDLSTGTGAVHTAPGHGEEDYLVGQRFGLPSPMPVDDSGVFGAGGGPFAGLSVDEANPVIVEWLQERGSLVAAGQTEHSYPHCWRCKQPVIFRATEQWFVSMDATHLREHSLRAINEVEWIPEWSINRISAMVADRPDWCISRQRAWGVPVPVFECAKCGETIATEETFDAVISLFEREGADAWFTTPPSEYLPKTTACPQCGSADIAPESDILDVWWESGVSHTSVLDARPELHRPAELYLEGSDQHRGWFQSSLLTSVGAYDAAPFRGVLTHGFIVDGEGRKMSKSLGNVVSPLDVIAKSGADIVRLWVAAADYGQDVNVSDEILERTSEAYRRIRNTFRFLLGNLADYTPARAVGWDDMLDLDRFALAQLRDLVDRVTSHYDGWRFHLVYRAIYDYVVTDLSAVYLDVLKDRLYADAADSMSRRSAQTVLAEILGALVRMLAPILAFTCEEVWQHMEPGLRDSESVHLTDWPVASASEGDAARLRPQFEVLLAVRDEVTRALEEARNEGRVGKSQEARIAITAGGSVSDTLRLYQGALPELFIVEGVDLVEQEGAAAAPVNVQVLPARGDKCPRCWNYRELGVDRRFPEVCGRCAGVLASADLEAGQAVD